MSENVKTNCTRCGSEIPTGVTHFCGSGFLNPSDEVWFLRTQLVTAKETIKAAVELIENLNTAFPDAEVITAAREFVRKAKP